MKKFLASVLALTMIFALACSAVAFADESGLKDRSPYQAPVAEKAPVKPADTYAIYQTKNITVRLDNGVVSKVQKASGTDKIDYYREYTYTNGVVSKVYIENSKEYYVAEVLSVDPVVLGVVSHTDKKSGVYMYKNVQTTLGDDFADVAAFIEKDMLDVDAFIAENTPVTVVNPVTPVDLINKRYADVDALAHGNSVNKINLRTGVMVTKNSKDNALLRIDAAVDADRNYDTIPMPCSRQYVFAEDGNLAMILVKNEKAQTVAKLYFGLENDELVMIDSYYAPSFANGLTDEELDVFNAALLLECLTYATDSIGINK